MPDDSLPDVAEQKAKALLEWLAATHGDATRDDVDILRDHLLGLRGAPLPPARHLQVLDFIYEHVIKIVASTLPTLHDVSLPISRKTRQEARKVQQLLETLSQDYLISLAAIFDPVSNDKPHAPEIAIWRAVDALGLHLMISHLAASPPEVGIWRMMHGAYRSARCYGLATRRIPKQENTLEQRYLSSILLACSQPASFSSSELEFIAEYIPLCIDTVTLSDRPQANCRGLFWIDPDKDGPASPLARRQPPPNTTVLFFACDTIASTARDHLEALEKAYPAYQLGLPAFAETSAGLGVLRRLAARWGRPSKRRFPRRRHSYRATLCAGLDDLWHLMHAPDEAVETTSEWMIINESPDGCAMMHMSGKTDHLRVGDLVAFRPEIENETALPAWNVCIVRWALSENPEHIELGLQILAPTGEPALVQLNDGANRPTHISGLLLPSIPPMRSTEMLVLHTGALANHPDKLTVAVGKEKSTLRELEMVGLSEQTASVEAFNVVSDGNRLPQ
ncbi:MAG: hypothetical protein ACM3SV_11895 [Betaproteobacteria bacterium]